MASQDWFEKDFYAILGVPSDADDKTIKSTYRKLAREWHPDAKPGDTAAEKKFKEIGEAYAVLSDPEQRKQYDAVRAMSRGGARFTAGGPGGGGGAGFEDVFAQMFGGGGGGGTRFTTSGGQGINIEDLLGGFGGGGQYAGGSPFGATRGPRRGRDVEARTTIDFTQAATGDTVTLQTPEGGRITTRIPAGVKDGQKIRLRGKGMPGDPGAPNGDLMLVVTVRPHPVFERDGNNLTVDLPVTFAEAALGATVTVPTLDGGTVRVKVAPGTPSGRVLRVKGRGIQTKNGTGDLLARVSIVVPQRLSDAAREAVQVLAAEEDGADPRADLLQRARE
ncbi:DnaJ domain-containing protein [Ornithinimicrobium sp. F0845]|uniref:DnaJ C-terminal domain-containing protein n=1 Tax=Ornithinimicrobium sp. F0845 TaxID=2926412 RepID=UPI001FF5444B|nr:DnaJ C-terminal domain-containing protein [Ornithinimicrobium sp. F0845]MCK0112707.1 DnaJ domain-containing protein [Ornithinimicrobium sp. F0845]